MSAANHTGRDLDFDEYFGKDSTPGDPRRSRKNLDWSSMPWNCVLLEVKMLSASWT